MPEMTHFLDYLFTVCCSLTNQKMCHMCQMCPTMHFVAENEPFFNDTFMTE